ncbi:chromate resistance protein ChrB domain-containing protein [Rufibacter latericius]|uniref:Helix-turn-helix domain-containing protein n=1 Tax=Rufibacter latericius TaxID=2487040 RepID=A0A3M9MZT9_9BACT|nr:chromate resistance protein ChrB domain-containing protein [Rufibacter latericius]RNI31059.1 helix-turn-helix domain-containing protein [Rufibacter latericius]
MRWITRERPKIDRLACPWLIRRFIDATAEIIYVPERQVLDKAKELDAVPFDIPGVEYSHYQDHCTFDYFLKKFDLQDPALQTMAMIVRGADTDDHSLAAQSAGLWAISHGMAFNITDDHELLDKAMVLYDGLYSWAKHLQKQKHTTHPTEQLFLEIYTNYLQEKKESAQKVPTWAQHLKEIIQDQIDTNLSLNLKEISEALDVHPTYVSRAFSKYFDNLSFGEYIRKLRIEKALNLLHTSGYTLAEVAYLTGFSDQSHFTRIFRQHMGQSPSEYQKNLRKGKPGSKG